MLVFLVAYVCFGIALWFDTIIGEPKMPFGLMDVLVGLPLCIIIGPPHQALQLLKKLY